MFFVGSWHKTRRLGFLAGRAPWSLAPMRPSGTSTNIQQGHNVISPFFFVIEKSSFRNTLHRLRSLPGVAAAAATLKKVDVGVHNLKGPWHWSCMPKIQIKYTAFCLERNRDKLNLAMRLNYCEFHSKDTFRAETEKPERRKWETRKWETRKCKSESKVTNQEVIYIYLSLISQWLLIAPYSLHASLRPE